MSETEDRIHRVTWRSILGINRPIGDYGEFLNSIDVPAAYYVREDGMVVFKRANGAITFTVAEPLVETIRPVEDFAPKATGGTVVVNVSGSAASEDDLVAKIRQGIQRRNPGTAAS